MHKIYQTVMVLSKNPYVHYICNEKIQKDTPPGIESPLNPKVYGVKYLRKVRVDQHISWNCIVFENKPYLIEK